MRLSEEQVKQGILHDDREVRFAALHYFANAFSRDATVMPVAIEAFREFGRQEAFPFTFPIADLAQTPETICWAIDALSQLDYVSEPRLASSLARLLCRADCELTLPRETEILAALDFNPDYREKFARRLRAHAMDDDACWREIEAICEADKSKYCVEQTRYHEAKNLALALARRGQRHAERMMALLAEDVGDLEDSPLDWLELHAVYMAGEMRYEPATPLVIGKLLRDEEVLNDECLYALAKIASDSAVRGVGQAFRSADWGFRLFASSVLGRIHSDLAVATASELLLAEEDELIRIQLATALADQFSTEGNELARQVLLDEPDDYIDLQDALLNSCTLLGQDFPELAEWRQDAEQHRRETESWERRLSRPGSDGLDEFDDDEFDDEEFDDEEFDDEEFDDEEFDEDEFDDEYDGYGASEFNALAEDDYGLASPIIDEPPPSEPVLRSHKTVGRNDPCPCGSGKKYKQCCLRKDSALE